MSTMYNIKLEIELIKLGFKRVWFSDKSGYWMEKNFRFNYLNFKLNVETDNKRAFLEVKHYDYFNGKLINPLYDTVAKVKCDLKSIKQILKLYK